MKTIANHFTTITKRGAGLRRWVRSSLRLSRGAAPCERGNETKTNGKGNGMDNELTQKTLGAIQSNQQSTTQSEPGVQPWELSKWIVKLLSKLYLARGIEIAPDRVTGFVMLLSEEGFYERHAQAAEEWILRGDWSSKGKNATLELADFFPSEKQLEKKAQQPIRYDGSDTGRRERWKKYLTGAGGKHGPFKFYAYQCLEIIGLGLAKREDFIESDRDGAGNDRYVYSQTLSREF